MAVTEPQEVTGEAPTALYRLYDAGGALLYVGITHSLKVRFAQHAAEKPWWPLVARKTVAWHGDRVAAEEAEADAIQREVPLHNVTYGTAPVKRSAPVKGSGRRTSIYMPDEVYAAWKASGLSISEVLRRGAAMPSPEETMARLAAEETIRLFGEIAEQAIFDTMQEPEMQAIIREIMRQRRQDSRDPQGSFW